MTSYLNYRTNIRPLDLVLFRGGDFVSDMIRHLQKYKAKLKKGADAYSHVGLVVTSEILDDPRLQEGKLYIWESTMSGRLTDGVCDIDGTSFLGVQLRDMDSVVRAYDADADTAVAVARLKTAPPIDDPELLRQRFTALFARFNGAYYEMNVVSLFATLFKCMRCARARMEDTFATEQWMFCSELVATVYRELGLFPESVIANNVVPMDFLGFETDAEGGVPVVVEEPVVVMWDGA